MGFFLPQNKKIFSSIENLASKAAKASRILKEFTKTSDHEKLQKDIIDLEKEADTIVHRIIMCLNTDHTRVTEEKADIRYFIHNLDNIIDGCEKVIARYMFREEEKFMKPINDFSGVIEKATDNIYSAVLYLKELSKSNEKLNDKCIKINKLENEADILNRIWLKKIYEPSIYYGDSNNVVDKMLLKEIVNTLENIMDECEDVANILDTFRLKGGI